MKNTNIELAKEIRRFLSEFAVLNPIRENEDDEKYTSPDAHQLLYCAECFENGTIPTRCWSEWGSGGYRPYTSKVGVETHNLLINKIYQIINGR